MKKSNAWMPWACFFAGIGFLILAMTKEGEYGYGWAWWAMGISFAATAISYLSLKDK